MKQARQNPDRHPVHQLAFCLTGQLDSDDFEPWMYRHAGKLGVEMEILKRSANAMSVRAAGLREMVDAFALATSLGPQSVCIDRLDYLDDGSDFWKVELSHG